MFNFTLPELVVIFVVALIVFGPKKLPELGKALGRAIGELKRSLDGVREQMNEDINATPRQTSDKVGPEGPHASGAPDHGDKPGQLLEHKNIETMDTHDSACKEHHNT
jgi:sec-independent protein translocase protein TatA